MSIAQQSLGEEIANSVSHGVGFLGAEHQRFETRLGKTLELEDPCQLALLHRMLDSTTRAPTLPDLETDAAKGNHPAADVAQILLSLIARGFAEPRLSMN